MLCSTISTKKPVCVDQNTDSATVSHNVSATGSGFEPFIADAVVSLVQNDTGAKHSFVLESVWPDGGLYEGDGNGLDSCATGTGYARHCHLMEHCDVSTEP